jgi:ATP-dependent DNA helicase RecG
VLACGDIHQILARQIVDVFVFQAKRPDVLPNQRWDDRINSFTEGNIIKTWRRAVGLYLERFAEQSFDLDPVTMQRKDSPPDYKAFRECMLNLLIHQDYGDQAR